MRTFVSGLALFVAGMMVSAVAQQSKAVDLGVRVNHVGIYVKNFEESVNFYTKTMGFREAFVFRDKDGKPTTMYVQVSKDTFLELAPATAEHPAGLNHIGFVAGDLKDTVAKLRQQGVKADDPRTGLSKAPLTNVADPDGVRLEILEFAPDSLQKRPSTPGSRVLLWGLAILPAVPPFRWLIHKGFLTFAAQRFEGGNGVQQLRSDGHPDAAGGIRRSARAGDLRCYARPPAWTPGGWHFRWPATRRTRDKAKQTDTRGSEPEKAASHPW